jgi:hypothetical protein
MSSLQNQINRLNNRRGITPFIYFNAEQIYFLVGCKHCGIRKNTEKVMLEVFTDLLVETNMTPIVRPVSKCSHWKHKKSIRFLNLL